MNKTIYITRTIPEVGLNLLKEKGINFDMGESKNPPSKKDIIKALKKKPYDGVISFLTDTLDDEVFKACPTAKIFANFSVGFNNANEEDVKKNGVIVTNTPGTSSVAVAEHTVALILALTTRLAEGDRYVRDGKYKGWDPNLLIGTDMKDKTIGLIGCGEIGGRVAKMLNAGFGSKIIYSDIKPNENMEKESGATRKETEDILKEADIISLHVPLLESTHHLINKDSLSKMKSSAFLVNTSRGPVVDEIALIDALKNNVIKGAALDVFEFEPKLSKGLNKLENVILTPHIASARVSARNMMSQVVAQNIISFFEKGEAINIAIK